MAGSQRRRRECYQGTDSRKGHTEEVLSWRGILVDLYIAVRFPVLLILRSSAYCQGLLVRCGDTRIQLPLSGLKRRCEMSFRIESGILGLRYYKPA